MKTTFIPVPGSILPSECESSSILLQPAAAIVTPESGSRQRTVRACLRALRVFLSGLVDDSAFQDISSGREISIIFTANGPLIYRWESDNGKPPARS